MKAKHIAIAFAIGAGAYLVWKKVIKPRMAGATATQPTRPRTQVTQPVTETVTGGATAPSDTQSSLLGQLNRLYEWGSSTFGSGGDTAEPGTAASNSAFLE